FKGNAIATSRAIRDEYTTDVDWSVVPAPATSETFSGTHAFDALNRLTESVTPDGSIAKPRYNEANLLEALDVHLPGAAAATPFVRNVDYDAKGQRKRIDYNTAAAPVVTEYTYDRDTFRLTRLLTTRPAFPDATRRTLQDLTYTFDPSGNVTH